MSPSRSEQIKALFERALELPLEERAAFLDEACPGDDELLQEVESLLEHADHAPDFFESLAGGVFGQPDPNASSFLDPKDDYLGKKINQYRIIDRIGRGGMGVVYLAEDTRLERKVALKFVSNTSLDSTEGLARFQREAKAAARLNHPNICTVHELGETGDQLYIVMEYVEGITLKERIEQGALTEVDIRSWLSPLVEGLNAAHEAGVVHRDIKPANIMITSRGRIKIMDFGIAKLAESETELTQVNSTVGTIAYMSPEQATGEPIDHRTDIWSVGVILYELATGRRPFQGKFREAMLYVILHNDPPAPRMINPDVSVDLERVINRCLQREREERYGSINALWQDLTGIVGAEAEPTMPGTVGKKRFWSYPAMAVSAGILGILFLAALVWLFSSGSSDEVRGLSSPGVKKQITFTGNTFMPALSPDGHSMVYHLRETDSTSSVYIQGVSGGDRVKILSAVRRADESVPHFNRIRWSPDGTMLAIAAWVNNDEIKLHVIPRFGGSTRTYDLPPHEASYAWSPDGSQIVLMMIAKTEIYLIDVATMESQVVYETRVDNENEYLLQEIDWSPTGDRWAFKSFDLDKVRYLVHTVSTNGTDHEVVLDERKTIFSLRWAADGESIYYLQEGKRDHELWNVRISPDGKIEGLPRFLRDDLHRGADISLSADNSRLLFYSYDYISNLWLYSLAQGPEEPLPPPEPLTEGTSINVSPRFSPDGRYIAYLGQHGNGYDVFTLSLPEKIVQQHTFIPVANQGTNIENLTNLAWHPDGDKIAFTAIDGEVNKLWQVDLRSGQASEFDSSTAVTNVAWGKEGILYEHSLLRFTFLNPLTGEKRPFDFGGLMIYPTFSPDGRSVAGFVALGSYEDRPGIWNLSLFDDNHKLLYPGLRDMYPLRWTPEGEHLYAYTLLKSPKRIIKIDSYTGKFVEMGSIPFNEWSTIDISPDGNHVVVPFSEKRSDIWLLENFDPEMGRD